MIARLKTLFQELRLRNRRDTLARITNAVLDKTGVLRSRFAAAPSNWTAVPSNLYDYADLDVFTHVVCDLPVPANVPQRADRIRNGEYQVFGVSVQVDAETIDWHKSIVQNGAWPSVHWTEIPFRRLVELGDIKYAWELARQQFLVPLAADSSSPNAETIEAFLDSFLQQNPREIGIHYISNLEIGIRSITWLLILAFLGQSSVDETLRNRLTEELFLNGRHLDRKIHFTAATGRNNHLIGDAACLLVIASAFPRQPEAEQWARDASTEILTALREQMLPSGMHFERSFGYHCFVMEFLLCVFLSKNTEDDLRQTIANTLRSMVSVIDEFETPDGLLPDINDDDSGYVTGLTDNRQDQRNWLIAVCDKFVSPNRVSDSEVSKTWSSGDEFLLAKNGNGDGLFIDHHDDPFPESGHNHSSLLHLLYWFEHEPVLVDSGTYRYNDCGCFRNLFRGTSCHNTIIVNGRGQADPSRGFGWLSKTKPGKNEAHRSDGYSVFAGEHRCYSEVVHHRFVYWDHARRFVAIRDQLSGDSGKMAEQFWHFSSFASCELKCDTVQIQLASSSLEMSFPGSSDNLVLTDDPAILPEAVFSGSYGSLTSKPVAVRSWKTDNLPRWTVIGRDAGRFEYQQLGDVESLVFEDGKVSFQVTEFLPKVL